MPFRPSPAEQAADAECGARTAWKPKAKKWPWRDFLTDDERATLEQADAAKAVWLSLNKERALITNRAIQRAIYASRARP